MRLGSTLLVAAVAMLLAGACALRDLASLASLPGDLWRERHCETPAPQPLDPDADATERELYAAALEADRSELLIATEDPGTDLLARARACDGGEPEACARLGGVFTYLLGRPEVGSELWADACEAGDLPACAALADLSWRPGTPYHDPEAAIPLYIRSCSRSTPRPHACRRLVEWPRGERSERRRRSSGMPEDRRFLLLDRACVLGDQEACLAAADFLREPPLELANDDPLVRHYIDEGLRFGPADPPPPDTAPRSPGAGGAPHGPPARKRALYASLLDREVGRTLRGALRQASARKRAAVAREVCPSDEPPVERCAPSYDLHDGHHCASPELAGCLEEVGLELRGAFSEPDELDDPVLACARECTPDLGPRDRTCVCGCLEEEAHTASLRALGTRCVEALALPPTDSYPRPDLPRGS